MPRPHPLTVRVKRSGDFRLKVIDNPRRNFRVSDCRSALSVDVPMPRTREKSGRRFLFVCRNIERVHDEAHYCTCTIRQAIARLFRPSFETIAYRHCKPRHENPYDAKLCMCW